MGPPPLTLHVHVSDGAQQAQVIVVVVSVVERVVEDLQCSVTFPHRAVCDADCVHHHQPVSHFKHVVSAETAVRVRHLWSEIKLNGPVVNGSMLVFILL